MDHRSPLDNIFNIIGGLPNGHDKPVKHALYNALAIFLLCLCCGAAYALHVILEPFLKPLIWALLVGSVLHPLKFKLARTLKSWLKIQDEGGTPVLVALLVSPLHVVNNFSEIIGNQLLQRLKFIIAIIVLVPLTHVVYYYTPKIALCIVWKIVYFAAKFVAYLMGNITFSLVAVILVLYTTTMLFFWRDENKTVFHYISTLIWLMLSCYVANSMGSFQIPIFILLLLTFLGGFVLEMQHIREEYLKNGQELTLVESLRYGVTGSKPEVSITEKSEIEDVSEKHELEELGDKMDESSTLETSKTESAKTPSEENLIKNGSESTKCIKVQRSLSQPYFNQSNQSFFNMRARPEMRMSLSHFANANENGENTSSFYLYLLSWACVIMIFWKNIWLLPLLPIPILLYIFKHLGNYMGLWSWIGQHLEGFKNQCMLWIENRYDGLVPVPMRGLLRLFNKLDNFIKSNLMDSIDAIASSVVICGLIIFVLCASIFILLQVYAETIMLVQMTSNVINQTVVHNPELRQLLPPTFDETVDSVLDNAYQYGRDGISKVVRGMLNDVDVVKSEKLEKQVLELWDRIYQTWMTSNESNGPKVTVDAVQTSWNAFLDDIQKSPEIFNINGLMDFAKQNVGTLMSLLDSVWAILKGNISLVLGSFSAFISVLLGGGTAVLNFILNIIIFLTTLFYLLSSSGNYYKPIEMMTKFSTSSSRFGLALEGAVNGVFTASFKMAVFHGMWTWFIHNLFGMNIVYLPSAFATILGAAPFLGTYWACVPAVLDLWLAQGRSLHAIIFFIFQFMPTSVVDTAIYAEIKGGGHPYLTGLAIAGGIFCLGIEGAIIGPLVLCGLYVAMDLSTTLFKESPSEETAASINYRQLSRMNFSPLSSRHQIS